MGEVKEELKKLKERRLKNDLAFAEEKIKNKDEYIDRLREEIIKLNSYIDGVREEREMLYKESQTKIKYSIFKWDMERKEKIEREIATGKGGWKETDRYTGEEGQISYEREWELEKGGKEYIKISLEGDRELEIYKGELLYFHQENLDGKVLVSPYLNPKFYNDEKMGYERN